MPSDEGRERKVSVWGKPCTVTVYRKPKSVWVAVGDYMGASITVQDSGEGAAIKRWIEAATHKQTYK
jgi:hypothetical protein